MAQIQKRKTVKIPKTFFIIDFDSTFIRDETIDVLAAFALKDNPRKEAILKKIEAITSKGMEGKLPFSDSLKQRLALFSPNRSHVQETVEYLKSRITPSVVRNRDFFQKNRDCIYIVSGGFKECIVPIVKEFGIFPSHVLANELRFNKKGVIQGVSPGILTKDKGKALAVKNLKLKGQVLAIGDGATDLEIRILGVADKFVAFTENVSRAQVVEKADLAIANFDELLFALNMPRAVSYPKSRLKILLLENIHPFAAEYFRSQGYQVETSPKALSETALAEKIKGVAILGIRSSTHVSDAVLAKATNLLTVGAFCIGTNQIDQHAATKRGVAVFNAPFSNGRSVVELTIGLIIMLARRVFDKSLALHEGQWGKSAKGAYEIRGKTLGIVGYGNIGSQLSVIAESLGLNVCFYDIVERPAIGNATRVESLEELLRKSDIVTLHVDGRSFNKGLIGSEQFSLMKPGALFLNISRGAVVDVSALAEALKSGHLGGAALDVFPEEPKESPGKFVSSLQGLSNVILTPHVGGSTEEAQESIARFLSNKLASFIDTGGTMLSVNLPNLQLPVLNHAHRLIHIHKNVPGVLAKINTLMGQEGVNILGQYLGTMNDVGYVITDVEDKYKPGIVETLKKMSETIRLRILY